MRVHSAYPESERGPIFNPDEARALLAELEPLRQRRGLKRGEFARQVVGLSPSQWSKITHGDRGLSRAVLDRLNIVAPGAVRRYYRRLRQRALKQGARV